MRTGGQYAYGYSRRRATLSCLRRVKRGLAIFKTREKKKKHTGDKITRKLPSLEIFKLKQIEIEWEKLKREIRTCRFNRFAIEEILPYFDVNISFSNSE